MFIKAVARLRTQRKGVAAEGGRGETPSGHTENIRMTVAFVRSAILDRTHSGPAVNRRTDRTPEKNRKLDFKQTHNK